METTLARFEAMVMNGANGAMETVYLADNTYALGGYYCNLESAQHAYNNGDTVAFVFDRIKNERFYLRNVNW